MIEKERKLVDELMEDLKCEYYGGFYLPHSYAAFRYEYPTRYAAETARKALAAELYHYAEKLFCPKYEECIAKPVVLFYSEVLKEAFEKWKEVFPELEEKIKGSEKHFRKKFDEELSENRNYYSVRPVNELIKEMEILEHDYRTETGLLRLIEGLASDKFEYTVENFWETAQELQSDIDRLTEEFKRIAQKEYEKYVAEITVMIKNEETMSEV